jgi:DNA-binding NtrC family response regulator
MRLLDTAKRVAQSEATVLITGETGSGKEIIARAIHYYSIRCSQPWVDVNCGALTETLIESELFGHEKGAFSGADSRKQGLFEMANNGTLYLDEVGELEPRMQVRLLRVLDGAAYFRVGSRAKVKVNVRIVAATNRNLEEEVRQRRFRDDLYHRICQIELQVPPLRERREDILPLARFFLEESGLDRELTLSARRALEAYDWPGNVRELKNMLIRASLMHDSWAIDAEHLDVRPKALPTPDAIAETGGSDYSLDEAEKKTIIEALKQTGGNQTQAALLLGISRRTLLRRLKTHDIQRSTEFTLS